MPIPMPEQVIADARGLLLLIREALRIGIERAGQFFDEAGQDADPWLGAHLTRWYAKLYLTGTGHTVHDLDEDYGTEDVSNSGLRGSFKQYSFVVRKPNGGLLPIPVSESQREWQGHNQRCFEFLTLETAPAVHLAILWTADARYRELTSLELALPKANGEAYWYESILHLAASGSAEAEAAADDLGNIQRRDDEEEEASGESR